MNDRLEQKLGKIIAALDEFSYEVGNLDGSAKVFEQLHAAVSLLAKAKKSLDEIK